MRQAVPFLWVRDIERSLGFYVGGLGFSVSNEWRAGGDVRWCSLTLDDVTLMIQEFWREGHDRNVPTEQTGIGVAICFVCDDAIALWRQVTARSVPAERPFVGNGMWVTEIVDPDGYHLLF